MVKHDFSKSSKKSFDSNSLVLRSLPVGIRPQKPRKKWGGRRIVGGFLASLLMFLSLVGGGSLLWQPDGSTNAAQAWDPACTVADVADSPIRLFTEAQDTAGGSWPGRGLLSPAGTDKYGAGQRTIDDYNETPGTGGSLGDKTIEDPSEIAGPSPTWVVYGDTSNRTAYEWYGVAGQEWVPLPITMFGSTCGGGTLVNNQMTTGANVLFSIMGFFADLGITLFSWAFSFDAFGPFQETLVNFIEGLQEKLFMDYLAAIVALSAIWVLWNGLVKRKYSMGAQGVGWILLASVFGTIFFMNPSFLIYKPNEVVAAINSEILSLGTTMSEDTDSGDSLRMDICEAGRVTNISDDTTQQSDQARRMSECVLWYSFIYTPWAKGQFGPASNAIIEPQYPLSYETENATVPLVYLDALVRNHDMVVQGVNKTPDSYRNFFHIINFLRCGEEFADDEANQAFAEKPTTAEEWANAPEEQKLRSECEYSPSWKYITGENWSEKFLIAIVSFISLFVAMGPLIFLAFTMVFMQLMAVFLFLIAPIVFTLGIHPGFGRKFALGWFEMLAANLLKRVATAALMSVIIMVLLLLSTTALNWVLQVVLMAGAGIGTMMMRKQVLAKVSNVNFGGNSDITQATDMITGRAANKAKMGGKRAGVATAAGSGAAAYAIKDSGSVRDALIAGTAAGIMGARGRRASSSFRSGRAMHERRQARRERRKERDEEKQKTTPELENQEPMNEAADRRADPNAEQEKKERMDSAGVNAPILPVPPVLSDEEKKKKEEAEKKKQQQKDLREKNDRDYEDRKAQTLFKLGDRKAQDKWIKNMKARGRDIPRAMVPSDVTDPVERARLQKKADDWNRETGNQILNSGGGIGLRDQESPVHADRTPKQGELFPTEFGPKKDEHKQGELPLEGLPGEQKDGSGHRPTPGQDKTVGGGEKEGSPVRPDLGGSSARPNSGQPSEGSPIRPNIGGGEKAGGGSSARPKVGASTGGVQAPAIKEGELDLFNLGEDKPAPAAPTGGGQGQTVRPEK